MFGLVLLRLDLSEAWRSIRSTDVSFLALSLAIQGVALLVATYRWQLIARCLDIRVPFARTLLYQLVGTGAAMVTPGQLGEFVKTLYHRRDGFPVAESVLSVLIDRAYDLAALLLFGVASMAILVGVPPVMTVSLATAGGLALVIAFLFVRNREASAQWIADVIRRISPKAYKESMATEAHRLAQRIGGLDLRSLIVWGLLTGVNYVLLLFRIYALFLAAGLRVPFPYFSMVVPLLRLVGLIPISVSGIGTRDVTAIYLLGRVGVSKESSVIVSMLGLVTVQFQALVGLLVWWRYPAQTGKVLTQPAEQP